MDAPTRFASAKILMIGFGNTLRGDDGVGPYVAGVVASWRLPGLESLAVPQLIPELAEPVAAAKAVIFVDAQTAGQGDVVELRSIEASESRVSIAHVSDPQSLLALAAAVYGSRPQAWLITIPAADFSFGEKLSSIAKRGAELAVAQVRAFLDCNLDVGVGARLEQV
jgi:hydrogenase maturation protease